jgi:hypothetical protein
MKGNIVSIFETIAERGGVGGDFTKAAAAGSAIAPTTLTAPFRWGFGRCRKW